MIRMSEDLRERLKIQAKANHISYNAYVVSILEKAVEPEWPHISPEELEALSDSMTGWLPPFHSDVVLDEDFDWKAAKAEYLLKKWSDDDKES